MDDTASRATAFWTWLVENQARLRAHGDPEQGPILDEIEERLHEYDPGLYFELGGKPGGTVELVITAEGKRERFPAVKDLIACAPALEGWAFIAFKPAHGFDFETRYGDAKVDPKTCWFLPMRSARDPERVGLSIGCPTFNVAARQDYENAILVVLDTALGEVRAAEDIAFAVIGPLPEDPDAEGYIALVELPQYLKWRKSDPGY